MFQECLPGRNPPQIPDWTVSSKSDLPKPRIPEYLRCPFPQGWARDRPIDSSLGSRPCFSESQFWFFATVRFTANFNRLKHCLSRLNRSGSSSNFIAAVTANFAKLSTWFSCPPSRSSCSDYPSWDASLRSISLRLDSTISCDKFSLLFKYPLSRTTSRTYCKSMKLTSSRGFSPSPFPWSELFRDCLRSDPHSRSRHNDSLFPILARKQGFHAF